MTVSLVMLGIMAGCGRSTAPSAVTDPAGATSVPPAVADVVDVLCSPAGTRVSATRFAARGDGVHIRVQNTSGASGVYLNYRHGRRMGPGGGEPVDSGTVLVLGPPPGPVELNCVYDQGSRQDRPVTIEVLDPAGAWRTGALATLGCSPPEGSLIDWVYRSGGGSTADAALAALAAQFDEPVTWRHVQEGYVAAARQTYVFMRAGKPWATASAIRSAPGSYGAHLGSLCSADKAASGS
jgi:hypothetical protein